MRATEPSTDASTLLEAWIEAERVRKAFVYSSQLGRSLSPADRSHLAQLDTQAGEARDAYFRQLRQP